MKKKYSILLFILICCVAFMRAQCEWVMIGYGSDDNDSTITDSHDIANAGVFKKDGDIKFVMQLFDAPYWEPWPNPPYDANGNEHVYCYESAVRGPMMGFEFNYNSIQTEARITIGYCYAFAHRWDGAEWEFIAGAPYDFSLEFTGNDIVITMPFDNLFGTNPGTINMQARSDLVCDGIGSDKDIIPGGVTADGGLMIGDEYITFNWPD